MRLALFLVTAASLACGPEEGGGPLQWSDEAQAALLGVRPEGSADMTRAWLSGTELIEAEVLLPRGGEGWIMGFEPSLEALQVTPGPVRAVAPSSESCENLALRSLPPAVFQAREQGRGWRAEARFEEAVFEDIRLPPLDLNQCVAASGCVDSGRQFCNLNCDPPPALDAPLAVRPPALPELCPTCPNGRSVVVPCAPGERFDPVLGRCTRVAEACPSEAFRIAGPSDPPTTYVDLTAPAGGDGSRARPFSALESAFASRGRILLAAGTYALGDLALSDAWIEGACPEGTRLQGTLRLSGSSTVAALGIEGRLRVNRGAFATLRGLELEARQEDGVALGVRGQGDAADVVIEGGTTVFESGRLELVMGFIRGAPALRVDGAASLSRAYLRIASPSQWVVRTTGNAELSLARAVVEATGANGVLVTGGRAALSEVVIQGNVGDTGVLVQTAGELQVDTVEVEGFASRLAFVRGDGEMRGSDLTLAQATSARAGLELLNGATVDLARVQVVGSDIDLGVAADAQCDATLEDLYVEGSRRGIRLEASNARIARVTIVRTTQDALSMTGPAQVDVEDLDVREGGTIGVLVGSLLDLGVSGTLSRARIVGASQEGVLLEQLGLKLVDVEIVGGVIGLHVKPGLDLDFTNSTALDRVRIVDNEFGLLMDRLVSTLAPRISIGRVEIRGAVSGIRLPSCWPDQGSLFSGLRFFDVDAPIQFTDPLDGT